MKAISIKQTWAHLVASGLKDIENRVWKTTFRGTVYIHACGKPIEREKLYDVLTQDQWDLVFDASFVNKFDADKIYYSAIIGQVDIIDCVINHGSIWAEQTEVIGKTIEGDPLYKGKPIYNFVLANAILYDKPILNVKGKLKFWEFRDLIECRCCSNKETDEEMDICRQCEQEFCVSCQAPYNQFSQIDFPCCMNCYESDKD